jgi:hypothetical protein
MPRKKIIALLALALGVGVAVPTTVASASAGQREDHNCARSFDAAVHEDMDAFNARDVDRYTRILHPRVIGVTNGKVTAGRDAVLADAKRMFAVKTWRFPYTIRTSELYGCDSGVTVVDANWLDATQGLDLKITIDMTLVREHGRWQVVTDASTQVSP